MKWSRIVSVGLLLATASTCLGAAQESVEDDDWDADADAQVSGDLFGLLALPRFISAWKNAIYVCQRISDTEFQTKRVGILGSLIRRIQDNENNIRGKCRRMCPELCACFSGGYERKLIARTCKCKGRGTICGKHALCTAQKTCQCKRGFTGSGQKCCRKSSLIDSIFCKADPPKAPTPPTLAPLRPPTPAPFFPIIPRPVPVVTPAPVTVPVPVPVPVPMVAPKAPAVTPAVPPGVAPLPQPPLRAPTAPMAPSSPGAPVAPPVASPVAVPTAPVSSPLAPVDSPVSVPMSGPVSAPMSGPVKAPLMAPSAPVAAPN